MTAPSGFRWTGSNVDATTIEREISRLWKELTTESATPHAVRTSILNLVVYTRDEHEAERISTELRSSSTRHPSRTIILIADRLKPGSWFDASVYVYCAQNGRGNPQCYEEITITAHGRVADHLDSLVIPLRMPQLPTYLWWPGQPPFGQRIFHRLLATADQLVIDSAQFNSPGDGLANLVRVTQAKQGVNDFNWARLSTWREILAQFFDGAPWVPYANGIRSVRLQFGAGARDYHTATAGTLLVLGWVGSLLGWEPETTLDGLLTDGTTLTALKGERLIDIDTEFVDHGPKVKGRLTGIDIVSTPKGLPPARFTVQRMDDLDHARILMKVHEGTEIGRVVSLTIKSDLELLTDELEIAGHDARYEQVVEMGSRMAGREIWVPA